MSVKKAFVFSLLAFILLNFMFTIIYFSIQGQLSFFFNSISENPFRVVFYLFQPIFILPWDAINGFFLFSEQAMIILLFGFICSPLIASIGAGNSGDRKFESLIGWLLTTLTCTVTWIVLLSYDSVFRQYINISLPLESATITIILSGFVVSVLYGISAVLFTFIKIKFSNNTD